MAELTEERVRQIVREEIDAAEKAREDRIDHEMMLHRMEQRLPPAALRRLQARQL